MGYSVSVTLELVFVGNGCDKGLRVVLVLHYVNVVHTHTSVVSCEARTDILNS